MANLQFKQANAISYNLSWFSYLEVHLNQDTFPSCILRCIARDEWYRNESMRPATAMQVLEILENRS